ncbi:MAG TPA: rhodanese-like domain-containing protein [Vicinamibacterales bacterium]|nr:rhodanese-like domain-containing protein [Vicinamibacterales bacterium]
MTADELARAIAGGQPPVVLDVRTPAEFAAGHVPGAVNIPFNQIGPRAGEIPAAHDAVVVVYCGHGPRAWLAARALRARGFSKVQLLKGHWAGWRKNGPGRFLRKP